MRRNYRSPFLTLASVLLAAAGVACSADEVTTAGTPVNAEEAADATAADASGRDGNAEPRRDAGRDAPDDRSVIADANAMDSAIDGAIDGGTDAVSDATGDDGGGAVDAGGDAAVCPMPSTTATIGGPYASYTCAQLAAAYSSFLDDAKQCGCDADCSLPVCDNFCCNCKSDVNPGLAASNTLTLIRNLALQNQCSVVCPKYLCMAPKSAACVAGRCVTTR